MPSRSRSRQKVFTYSPEWDRELFRKAFAAWGKIFRGPIWEHAPGVPMGKGYSNEGRPFDIETACYLKPVFRGIADHTKRKIVLKKAVQTLGTFGAEKSAAYFAAEEPGEMVMYDCDLEAARDHAKSRLKPFLDSIPGILSQMAEAKSRHDLTTKEFYLPGMTLRIWPLNESSTQRITLRYVIIHDAFLSKKTGMIGQAIARTTQHPHDKKIIIESQGGDEGDDFDAEWRSTDMKELHVNCPLCGKSQPFEFTRQRDDGTWAGFQRGPDSKILLPDGSYNEAAVIRETYYECFHCRGVWLDRPDVRLALDQSSHYLATNPNANPDNDGYTWPCWINQRIPWGGEQVMLGYLQAKAVYKRFGNIEPLRQWWQKRAAKSWNEKLERAPVAVITQSASDAKDGFLIKVMSVDCQQGAVPFKTGKFWYVVRGVTKSRELVQLARGYAENWKEWQDVQKQHGIYNCNVALDGGNYLDEILDAAAANYKLIKNPDEKARKRWPLVADVWTILIGDGRRRSYPHGKQLFRSFSKASCYQREIVLPNGARQTIDIEAHMWSNLSVKDHFYRLLRGGPNLMRFTALQLDQLPEKTRAKETGDLAYAQQIQNQHRGKDDNGNDKWLETSPNVHYPDCECGCVVLLDMRGYMGLPAMADGE